ncbi:MAG: hypothetical protein GY772_20575 [bacterium]|nr:hypothetical protein [bacterium]
MAAQVDALKTKIAADKPVLARLQGAVSRKDRIEEELAASAAAVASASKLLADVQAKQAKLRDAQAASAKEIHVLQQELAATAAPSGAFPPALAGQGLAWASLCTDLSASQLEVVELQGDAVVGALRLLLGELCDGLRKDPSGSKRPASPSLAPGDVASVPIPEAMEQDEELLPAQATPPAPKAAKVDGATSAAHPPTISSTPPYVPSGTEPDPLSEFDPAAALAACLAAKAALAAQGA